MKKSIKFIIFYSLILFTNQVVAQYTGNTKKVTINGKSINVFSYEDLNTQNGTLRFLFVTNDIEMPQCAENYGFVIENIDKRQRLLAEAWGFNGISPIYNSNGSAKYFYNPEFGEKIYMNLGNSGCGSGYAITSFEVKYVDNGRRVKLEKLFDYNETTEVIYEPRTARIYLLEGIWNGGTHFGSDRKYNVSVYSMVHNNRTKNFVTNRKYKDVKSDISPESLLAQIKKYEKF